MRERAAILPTEPASFNKYNYCLGNPLRYVDPDGHQTVQADGLIVFPAGFSFKVINTLARTYRAVGVQTAREKDSWN